MASLVKWSSLAYDSTPMQWHILVNKTDQWNIIGITNKLENQLCLWRVTIVRVAVSVGCYHLFCMVAFISLSFNITDVWTYKQQYISMTKTRWRSCSLLLVTIGLVILSIFPSHASQVYLLAALPDRRCHVVCSLDWGFFMWQRIRWCRVNSCWHCSPFVVSWPHAPSVI